MALPPEQINIKRRREEEPVETLYIQSELHQTKRRFTDFVFQRVQIRGKDGGGGDGDGDDDASASASSPASGVPEPARQRVLRTPRSVSSLKVTKGGNRNLAGAPGSGAPGTSGVPLVRATSPGAEIREEKRLIALRREKEEKIKRAVYSPQSPPRAESSAPIVPSRNENAGSTAAGDSGRSSPASISSTGKPPIRRFQISRSSTNTPLNLHRRFDSGIQKRKGVGAGTGGSDGVAVLVEKLRRKPHSRQASMAVGSALQSAGVPAAAAGGEIRPRKRPVVNQAEKKWREEGKNAISAAKEHISHVMDKGAQAQHQNSNWDDESERLAGEFERIALELDGGNQVDETKRPAESTSPAGRTGATLSNPPKPSLKYQPRTPNKPRSREHQPAAPTQHDDDGRGGDAQADSDDDYVYDVYIRRPLPQTEPQSQTQPQIQATKFKNPLTDLETPNALLGPNVGVIVITQEDESYWENFIEDDDDDEAWDSEDADSNAENNPANDYPDEELSWDGSDDDDYNPFARYRQAGFDEDFDFDGSGSEGSIGPGLRRAGYGEYDSDEGW